MAWYITCKVLCPFVYYELTCDFLWRPGKAHGHEVNMHTYLCTQPKLCSTLVETLHLCRGAECIWQSISVQGNDEGFPDWPDWGHEHHAVGFTETQLVNEDTADANDGKPVLLALYSGGRPCMPVTTHDKTDACCWCYFHSTCFSQQMTNWSCHAILSTSALTPVTERLKTLALWQ